MGETGTGGRWACLSKFLLDGETPGDSLGTERQHTSLAFAWRYRHEGIFHLSHEYQRNQRPFHFGTVMIDGTPLFDQHYTAPGQETQRRYQRTALDWRHRFSPHLALAASHAWADVRRSEALLGHWSVLNADTLSGYYTHYKGRF